MKELKTWKDVIQAMLDGESVQLDCGDGFHKREFTPDVCQAALDTAPRHPHRIKPRTIMIGDMEVPEPVRDVREFNEGDTYYLPNLSRSKLYDLYIWSGDDVDLRLLKRGLIQKTEEAVLLHAKALIKISGGSYEHRERTRSV